MRLYEEAKRRRIVLTQQEFAEALGYKSRMHLFGRLLKGHGEIPDRTVKMATDLLKKDTKNVKQVQIMHREESLSEKIGELTEAITYLKASDRIQGMWVAELSALVKNTSFATEALQLEESVRREVDRLLGELSKK